MTLHASGFIQAPAADGQFPPFGDTGERAAGFLDGSIAQGPNGGWPWKGWGSNGWIPITGFPDGTPSMGQAAHKLTTTQTVRCHEAVDDGFPDAGEMWVEVTVDALPTVAPAFGPAVNVDTYGIVGTCQGFVARLRPDGHVDFYRVTNNQWTPQTTAGSAVPFEVGDRLALTVEGDNFLRVYRNRPQTGPGSHVAWAQQTNSLSGRSAGFVHQSTDPDTGARYSNFLADGGIYPYR